ncbi:MAG: hypothetical protein CM1200mP4_5370 [Rhodospirillaceae bacterium]|nr:MAG: hypothetical protein CM1200mP4_5370 [Rhodospirillaceae bacterium]
MPPDRGTPLIADPVEILDMHGLPKAQIRLNLFPELLAILHKRTAFYYEVNGSPGRILITMNTIMLAKNSVGMTANNLRKI